MREHARIRVAWAGDTCGACTWSELLAERLGHGKRKRLVKSCTKRSRGNVKYVATEWSALIHLELRP